MKFERKCAFCGKMFIAHNRNTKTCSPECSQGLRKEYRKKWLEDHPHYMKNYFVEHRERYSRAARKERKEKALSHNFTQATTGKKEEPVEV